MSSKKKLNKRIAVLERRVDMLSKDVAALRKRKNDADAVVTKNKKSYSKTRIRLSDIVSNWEIVRLFISILRIVFDDIISMVRMVFDGLDIL